MKKNGSGSVELEWGTTSISIIVLLVEYPTITRLVASLTYEDITSQPQRL